MVADRDANEPPPSAKTVATGAPAASGDVQSWVRITLFDGSEVIMTASHPMYPEGTTTNSGYTLGALKAEDLVPGVDSLIVFSARPVVVKCVTAVPPEETPAGRVQLELGRSQAAAEVRSRRALLMTLPQEPGGPDTGSCFVGVCDSAVEPASTRFDALEEDADTASQTTRSGSWPSTAEHAYDEVRKERSKDDVEIVLGSVDERHGWRRSIRPDGEAEWYRVDKAEALRTVRLSDIRALPRASDGERLSYGSISHAAKNENCKVCVFNRKNGSLCRNGWACTFCHAWHQPYVRPRRPDKRRPKHGNGELENDGYDDNRDGGPDGFSAPVGQVGAGGANAHSMVEPWYVNPSGIGTGLSLSPTVPPPTGSMSSGSSRGFC